MQRLQAQEVLQWNTSERVKTSYFNPTHPYKAPTMCKTVF